MDVDQLTRQLRAEAESGAAPDVVAGRQAVGRRVRRQRTWRAGLAVVVVLVLVGLGVGLAHRSDSSAQKVVTTPGTVPHLVPSYVPSQVHLGNLDVLPLALADQAERSRMWIYTPVGGSSSPGAGLAVVTSVDAERASRGTQPSPPAVTTFTFGSFRGVTLWTGRGSRVSVMGRGLNPSRAESVARSARVAADGLTLLGVDLPGGDKPLVAGVPTGNLTSGAVLADPQAHGYLLAYPAARADEVGDREVLMSVTLGEPADLEAIRWELDDASSIVVGGHEATLASFPGGSSVQATPSGQDGSVSAGPKTWVVAWLDGDALITIEATGGISLPDCIRGDCTPAALTRMAASLRPVSDAEWQALAHITSSTEPSCATTTVGTRGVDCTDTGPASPTTTR